MGGGGGCVGEMAGGGVGWRMRHCERMYRSVLLGHIHCNRLYRDREVSPFGAHSLCNRLYQDREVSPFRAYSL